jgi:hypothetical protein
MGSLFLRRHLNLSPGPLQQSRIQKPRSNVAMYIANRPALCPEAAFSAAIGLNRKGRSRTIDVREAKVWPAGLRKEPDATQSLSPPRTNGGWRVLVRDGLNTRANGKAGLDAGQTRL